MPERSREALLGPMVSLQAGDAELAASRPSDDVDENKDGRVVGTLPPKALCAVAGAAAPLTIRFDSFHAARASVETRIARNVPLPALAELRAKACGP